MPFKFIRAQWRVSIFRIVFSKSVQMQSKRNEYPLIHSLGINYHSLAISLSLSLTLPIPFFIRSDLFLSQRDIIVHNKLKFPINHSAEFHSYTRRTILENDNLSCRNIFIWNGTNEKFFGHKWKTKPRRNAKTIPILWSRIQTFISMMRACERFSSPYSYFTFSWTFFSPFLSTHLIHSYSCSARCIRSFSAVLSSRQFVYTGLFSLALFLEIRLFKKRT